MAAPTVMKPIEKIAFKYLGPDLFGVMSANHALEAKFEALLTINIATIVLICLFAMYHYYKMYTAKKVKADTTMSSFESKQKSISCLDHQVLAAQQ